MRGLGHVQHVADVVAGLGVVLVDRGHVPVEEAVVVEVGHRLPHPVVIDAGAGDDREVGERAVGVVDEVAAGLEVGRDEQLRIAVTVGIHEGGLEAPDEVGGHTHDVRDVLERSVSVVVIETCAFVIGPPRGHAQVEQPVDVVVAEGRAVPGGVCHGVRQGA